MSPTIFLLGKNTFNSKLADSIKVGLIILFVPFAIRQFLFIGKNIFKYLHKTYRDSKYGDAIILLKNAFLKVHQLRQKSDYSEEESMITLKHICDQLRHLFVNKNMCECSVSIKVAVRGDIKEDASVINLCRDMESGRLRDSDRYREVNHTIIGNTAFLKVLNNIKKNQKGFYLNNCINKTENYDNTSREVYSGGKLPYNSEIVVPIMPAGDEKTTAYTILGFLCVDCAGENKFDEKYDTMLVEGVAEGIYDVLQHLKNKE